MRHTPGKGKSETPTEFLVQLNDEEDVFEDPDI
jgi:hypothetical protein